MSEKADKSEKAKNTKGGRREPGTSTVEWIVAGIGCLVVLGTIAYLVFDGLSGHNGPAIIVVEPLEVHAGGGGYVVQFSAANREGKSVASVEIKGELRQGDEVVEESSVTLDYLPQQSERTGALIFQANPADYDLALFASGYTTP